MVSGVQGEPTGSQSDPVGTVVRGVVADRQRSRARAGSVLGARAIVFVFSVVVVVHALSPSVQIGDSRLSVPVAAQVLEHRNLDLRGVSEVESLDDRYDLRVRDGRLLPFFPWPPMLFALPGVAAAELTGQDPASLAPSDPNQTWIIEIPTASILVGLTAVLMALIAFQQVSGSTARRRRLAVGTALLFAFATGAWSTGSRALWSHTPSMLLLAAALYLALRIERPGWRNPVLFGACLGGAYIMRPTNAVAVGVFLIWVLLSARHRIAPVLAGIGSVAIPFAAVSLVSYGSVLPPYYAGSRFGTEITIPFAETAAMYLVSPSRGLFVYDPVVIVAGIGVGILLRGRRFTSLHAAVVTIVVGQWLVIARYGSTGGSAYGPRLMTDVLPYVVFLAIPVLDAVFDRERWSSSGPLVKVASLGLVALIAWSVLVNAVGATVRSAYCWSATPVIVDRRPSRIWQWSDPQFLRPFKDLSEGASVRDLVAAPCDSTRSAASAPVDR